MNIYIYMFFSGGGLKLPIPPRVKENRGTTAKGMALDESIVFPLSVQCGVLFGSGKTAVDMLLP